MNNANESIPMGDAEWQKIVKSIPVVCDITETTAEGIIRQILKAVFEKNGLPVENLDAVVSTVIAHSLDDICFTAMHGLAIPHGYVSGLENLLVGVGILRHGHSIDFNAIDGARASIFFVILCSDSNNAQYRKFLARLCGCLISGGVASRLVAVSTCDDLEALLCGAGDMEGKQ